MNRKIILASIIAIIFTVSCSGFSNDKQEKIYEIIENANESIKYPQIHFLNENGTEKEQKLNALILNTLYGPYSFLSDPELAKSITYEVTYNDKNYLSICYSGTYAGESVYTGDVGYAITIDLNNETIAGLEDIIGSKGLKEIVSKIENGEFETEYGAITPDNQYADINSVIQAQPIANCDSGESQYYYFLRDKKIGIIIAGLPRYGGNYSIISVNYPWKS